MTMYYLLTDQQPTTLISSQYQLGFFKNTVLFTCMKDELTEYLKYFNKWIRYFADIIAFVQAGCQSRDITYCSNPTNRLELFPAVSRHLSSSRIVQTRKRIGPFRRLSSRLN